MSKGSVRNRLKLGICRSDARHLDVSGGNEDTTKRLSFNVKSPKEPPTYQPPPGWRGTRSRVQSSLQQPRSDGLGDSYMEHRSVSTLRT